MAFQILRMKDVAFKERFSGVGEIVFVESGYNLLANKCIKENMDFIKERLASISVGYRFVYAPTLNEDFKENLAYIAPYLTATIPQVSSRDFLNSCLSEYLKNNLPPCFFRYSSQDDNGNFIYKGFAFCLDSEEGSLAMLETILPRIAPPINNQLLYSDIGESGLKYSRCNDSDLDGEYRRLLDFIEKEKERRRLMGEADWNFEEETKELICEVAERIERLRQSGVSEWVLKRLAEPKQKLSRVEITPDHRILLPDYNDMEVQMEPISKAVWLLFLRHPEGIVFKHLPDYRHELEALYAEILSRPLSERQRQTIIDVTDPMKNSINEKCARIRSAFISRFDDSLAQEYYIRGRRGEAKTISLPRELVILTN